MQLNIKHIAAAGAIITSTILSANAQSQSAYFVDNYLYNFQLNPAMSAGHNAAVALPAIGNINIGTNGNIGLKNFLYPTTDHRTAFFMNPNVSTEEFLGSLPNSCRLGMQLREGLLTVGFKGLGGFNHISINTVAGFDARMPKDLFAFLKEGVSSKEYHFGNVNAQGQAYAEFALNHSHDLSAIVNGLKVGASLKFLVGLASMQADLDKVDINLGANQDFWSGKTAGSMRMNLNGMHYNINKDGYIDGINADNFSPIGGYGFAADLGATYAIADWDFALAVNDLGFINWKESHLATTNGERSFSTEGKVLNPDHMDDYFDELSDDLAKLYQLNAAKVESYSQKIAGTLNASVRYTLPVYRRLSVGVLNSTRMNGIWSANTTRFSASISPLDWVGMSVNYGIGTYGSSFGWVLNTSAFFIGMDYMPGSMTSQMVPLSSNFQLSLGTNFVF